MKKLITVINRKGGTGKTTTAVHLAFAASEAGYRTLLVDLDGQGNASQFLTGDMTIVDRPGGAEQIFAEAELAYTETQHPGLFLLHGHDQLDDILDIEEDAVKQIRNKIRSLPFDYVIFDTPPAKGMRQLAPLYWCDLAVVVIEPTLSSMSGLNKIITAVKAISRFNAALSMRIVVNQVKSASSSHKDLVGVLRQKFGINIVGEFASRTAVENALDAFTPVWKFRAADSKLRAQWKAFTHKVLGHTAN